MMIYDDILNFWFNEIDESKWWFKDAAFDDHIKNRFHEIHAYANQCELYHWRETAKGRLAEIIILDQFSRNMFRDTAKSFASDSLALALSQEAISVAADKQLNAVERSFLYMPFMHSESLKIHDIAIRLYKQKGLEYNLEFEIKHKHIIEKFGRYPHRNKSLNRVSTTAEIQFLKQPDSSF